MGKQIKMQSVQDDNKVMEVAMTAGHILLENGAEISRVEETMERICRHFGVESESFFVLSNGIFTTGSRNPGGPEGQFAKVLHIPVKGVRFDRVVAVNQLSREVEEGLYTIEQTRQKLEQIRQMPGKRSLIQVLSSGVGSACFCYLLGGSLADSGVAFVSGFLLYIYVLSVSRLRMSKITKNLCGGVMVTLICILSYRLGLGEDLSRMIIGTIMPLVPGVAFTNGIRDIADGDYISGAVRLLDAILVFLSVAIGVGVMFIVYHRVFGGEFAMIGQVVGAFFGTVAFSVLYGVPRQYYAYCGFVGGAGWCLYLVLTGYTPCTATEATLFATFLVVFLSRFLAVWERCPATVFLTTGIFPLVPGAGIYWTAYYLVTDRPAQAADNGFAAIKAAFAIVLGIVLVFEVPDRFFRMRRKHG